MRKQILTIGDVLFVVTLVAAAVAVVIGVYSNVIDPAACWTSCA